MHSFAPQHDSRCRLVNSPLPSIQAGDHATPCAVCTLTCASCEAAAHCVTHRRREKHRDERRTRAQLFRFYNALSRLELRSPPRPATHPGRVRRGRAHAGRQRRRRRGQRRQPRQRTRRPRRVAAAPQPPPPRRQWRRRRPRPVHASSSADTKASRATTTERLLVLGGALDDVGAAEATSAAGGNETDLLAGGRRPADGRGVANVLVVTTTVGVLHGVHGHTTHLCRGEGGAWRAGAGGRGQEACASRSNRKRHAMMHHTESKSPAL